MAHYLKTRLALTFKIGANFQFLFPLHLMKFLEAKVTSHEQPKENLFLLEKKQYHFNKLAFTLAFLLKKIDHPDLMIFKRYSGKSIKRRYELAIELARVFDTYFFYLPNLFKESNNIFNDGLKQKHFKAQKILYEELLKICPIDFPGKMSQNILDAFKQQFKSNKTKPIFTELIHVFGISFLPPFYIHFLKQLAKYVEVNFYFFSVSHDSTGFKEGFNFIKDFSQQNQELLQPLKKGEGAKTILIDRVKQYSSEATETKLGLLPWLQNHLYSAAYKEKIKKQLQSNLKKYSSPFFNPGKIFPDFMLHACSSKLNEVEVLKDVILNIITTSKEQVNVSDFLIVAPDINDYHHYIKSVFNTSPHLKHSISDLTESKESVLYSDLEIVFNFLLNTRKINDFLKILQLEKVKKKFSFSSDEIKEIKRWLKESNVHWGKEIMDEKQDSKNLNHSWEKGMKKIVYSHFMIDHELGQARSLVSDLEETSKDVLSKFLLLYRKLTKLQEKLFIQHSLKDWLKILQETFSVFFATSSNIDFNDEIFFKIIASIERDWLVGDHWELLDFAGFKTIVDLYFKNTFLKGGFLTGGITFASLLPMRTIPFKYVFILGLESARFPEKESYKSHNLIHLLDQQKTILRSSDKDDRLILLENLFCAEKFLGLSYTSNGEKNLLDTNLAIPVIDVINDLAKPLELSADELFQKITTFHPSNKYDPRYYEQENFFTSFDRGYFFILNQKNDLEVKKLPFYPYDYEFKKINESLEKIIKDEARKGNSHEVTELNLTSLYRYYSNPLQYYFNNVLKMNFDFNPNGIEELPLTISKLTEKKLINQSLGVRFMAKVNREFHFKKISFEAMNEKGILPLGRVAFLEIEAMNEEIKKIFEIINLREIFKETKLFLSDAVSEEELFYSPKNLNFNLSFSDAKLKIIAQVNHVFDNVKIVPAFKIKFPDFLKLWLEHLLMHVNNTPITSYIIDIANKEIFYFKTLDPKSAEECLKLLLYFFYNRREFPLPFLEKTNDFFLKEQDKINSKNYRKIIMEAREEIASHLNLYHQTLFLEEYFFNSKAHDECDQASERAYLFNEFFFKTWQENLFKEKI